MSMATWTPRKERQANKSGASGDEKKRAKRRAKLMNQQWCNASFNLTQRRNNDYNVWCRKIDSALGIRRGS